MRRLLRLWRVGRSDLQLLWFALRHPERPVWLIPVTIVLGLYAIEPVNFAVPFVGVLDDFVLLPLVLHGLLTLLPANVRSSFGRSTPLR